MASEPTAAQIKAEKRRKTYVRAILIMLGITVVLGVIGAIIPAPTGIAFIAVAYFAGFAALMTLLYAFWHNIIGLPGQKAFDDKVASGEIVPEEPKSKKKKSADDA